MARSHDEEPKQDFGGITASKKPRLEMIPYAALASLADRFELGESKHGETSWSALQNAEALRNEPWIRARIAHVIHHAYQYLQKMEGIIEDDGDDDAAAIMWGGCCLHEAVKYQNKRNRPIPSAK